MTLPPKEKEDIIKDDEKKSSIHEVIFPSSHEDNNTSSEKDHLQKASWQLKLSILILMLALPEATMGTLKTSLKKSMQINNTQFSILLSSVTLVNTILPLLAGIFIDDLSSLGSIRGTTLVSIIIFIGSAMVSIAANENSYPIMVTGQIIIGLGGGMIVTMQEGILSRWFRDKQLAIVIGILLCIARLTKWVAKMVCYPIVNRIGSHTWPIHIATIFCALGVLTNAIYWLMMYQKGWATLAGREMAHPKANYRNQFQQEQKPFKWSARLFLHVPATFWMVPWTQLIMSSVFSSFDDIATEFVQFRFQTTSVMAGYQSSLTQVAPIVIAPVMGLLVHRYGRRLTSLFIATLVLLISLILLAYTWTVPAVGMILFSIALALGPVSVLTSTALLLPHELAGTGMALKKCSNNIGTTILSVLVGYVQDLTYHDGNPHDDVEDLKQEYDGVMILYLVLACCSSLMVAIFWFMDRKLLDGWLQADKKERERRLDIVAEQKQEKITDESETAKALQRIGSYMRPTKSYIYISFYGFWLVVSWIVFFVFALMPLYHDYDLEFA
ncbi:hypothetical protein DFQ28_011276 [Apophysomyces sp. BC1034]|nr:hypothetical protein DFQ28_011276 [Apophysomyces sp. BC1034]